MASPMPRLPPETISVRSVNVDMGLLDSRRLFPQRNGIDILILGKSHIRCLPGVRPPFTTSGAPCSVHVSTERYWHSHFLQVRYPLMSEPVQTPSGIPLEAVYGPADRAGDQPAPGVYPFTRGNFSSDLRGKTWTFRQYSGFGTAEESNRRYRYLLDQGGTGLSVALDLPTQCGYDSDDTEYGEEVGRVGVAVDTLADAEILFDGIALDKISTSFTINGTAAILLAFYVAAAEKKGVPRAKLTGTIQNDILKEYASRGTWTWPPEPSLRLIADTIEF